MRLIILLIFCPFLSFGQYFGVKGLASTSWSSKSLSNRQVISAGIFFNKDFKSLSFRTEALFRLDGFSDPYLFPPKLDNNGDTIRNLGLRIVDYQFNYIEIPFLFHFKFGHKIKPYVGAGASAKFGVLSKRRLKFSRDTIEIDPVNSSGFDVNIIFNSGIEFQVKDRKMHLEIRFNKGLVAIIDNKRIHSASILLGINI